MKHFLSWGSPFGTAGVSPAVLARGAAGETPAVPGGEPVGTSETIRIAINGVHYAVRQWGAGPPLVLLHGFTGSGALWAVHAAALAGRFRVIAPDLLGHGESDAPADPSRYAMANAVADLAALLDALGVARTALLGYSLGGRVALAFACERPHRVARLILEGASPGLADADQRTARRAADEQLAQRLAQQGLAAFIDAWMAQPLFATQAVLPTALRTTTREARLRNDPAGLAACLRGLGTGSQPSYWDRLNALPMPTQLLAGEHDAKFRALATAMGERIANATVRVVPDAGHTTHLENPSAFRQLVRAFLTPTDAAQMLTADG